MDSCLSRWLLVVVALSAMSACGGGGSGSPPPSSLPTPAPANLSYPSPNVFAVGSAITALSPTVTGSVSSYTVSPSLPPGLALSGSTGTISGTPTAVAAAASYTVTAANAGGSTTFPISITVNDIAPSIGYGSGEFVLTTGVPIHTLTPSNSGGTVTTWSMSPALPPGLTFSATDGSIGGTPATVAAAATYVVTATNSAGQSTASLTIAVETSVLLELGHGTYVAQAGPPARQNVKYSGSRILSQDISGHWVLWDYATARIIANGDSPMCGSHLSNCSDDHVYLTGDLAGPTTVIGTTTGLEVRASADGRILAAIPVSFSWWRLATDGSYVCAGSPTGLSVWSPSGNLLLSRTGDYSRSISFAAPGELRIALGAAGPNVVETISLATGTSSISPPFQGQFHSWFIDGERFLTNIATTVWTYSKVGVQQDLTSLPTIWNLTGQGAWFWTHPVGFKAALEIYAVGASASPTASYSSSNPAMPSGKVLGLMTADNELTVIDLAGSSVSDASFALPYDAYSSFAATSRTQWVIAATDRILDGRSLSTTPRYFGLGMVPSIAGSNARIAVATHGGILYFDAQTKAPEGTIDFSSSKVALSSDGTILAAAGAWPDYGSPNQTDPTRILSLPSGTETYTWPYAPVTGRVWLSGSGTALGQLLQSSNGTGYTFTRQVTAPNGGPVIWSDSFDTDTTAIPLPAPIRLSPDGTLIAVATSGEPAPSTGTNIFKNGNLVAAVPGWAVGWIDNDRLLVNSYTSDPRHVSIVYYAGCSIYDASGAKLASPALPELQEIQTVTADQVYSPKLNQILSLTTGAPTWTSANPSTGVGAVAGSRVVFVSGARVLAEPY